MIRTITVTSIDPIPLMGQLLPHLKAQSNRCGLIGVMDTMDDVTMRCLIAINKHVAIEDGTLTLRMIANSILRENWELAVD